MKSSAPPGIPPGIPSELPAAHDPLTGDDETACLLLPVTVLPPLAASKRPAVALSPTDVVFIPAFPCTAEGSVKCKGGEPRQVPLPPGWCTGSPPCGLSARSAALYCTERARGTF